LIIILNISTKALHGHLYHLIKKSTFKNGFEDVKDVKSLVEKVKSLSEEVKSPNASVQHVKSVYPNTYANLNHHCFYNIPNSVEDFDITKSVALIQNVFNKIFEYNQNKFVFCELLRDIRNNDYAHKEEFEMDDIDFSATVVKIEEIIRQLCDYDKTESITESFLTQIEEVLGKDSYNINELKSLMSEVLVELKEELELFNSKIDKVLEGLDEVKEIVESKGNEVAEKVESKGNEVAEKVESNPCRILN